MLCAVPLLVRLKSTWKHLTCWNSPRCYALFLDPRKNLSDVESIFEKQHKNPVITNAKSLYDAVERSESSTRNLTERRTAIEVTAIRQRLEHGFICTGWVTLTGNWQTDSRNLRQLGSHLRSCLRENGKTFGTRLSRVEESSWWQNGQKAKEIWMGDEFSMIILQHHVTF